MKIYYAGGLLFFFGLISAKTTNAQYNISQNKVWAMGNQVGLDFNNATNPTAITTQLGEAFSGGAASVCDNQGQLLFYSNSKQVWTAAGTLMPHGSSLTGGNSNTANAIQGSLIVPFIGPDGNEENNRNKYYLFTIDNGFTGKLYCNLIDMSLNNGQGDVDTAFPLRGVLLADSLSGKLIAVPGCDNNIWVLVHDARKAIFRAFEVSESGISQSPVLSNLSTQFPASPYDAFINGTWRRFFTGWHEDLCPGMELDRKRQFCYLSV